VPIAGVKVRHEAGREEVGPGEGVGVAGVPVVAAGVDEVAEGAAGGVDDPHPNINSRFKDARRVEAFWARGVIRSSGGELSMVRSDDTGPLRERRRVCPGGHRADIGVDK
jgi:hypothetical protein